MSGGLRIGEVAAGAGVNVQTLRFYERRGLIDEPPRRSSGYRHYSPKVVERVRFIKRAQELGFSLREVEELLGLRSGNSESCDGVRQRAERKIAEIDVKLRQLTAIRGALSRLVKSCRRGDPQGECPILESLSDEALS